MKSLKDFSLEWIKSQKGAVVVEYVFIVASLVAIMLSLFNLSGPVASTLDIVWAHVADTINSMFK